MTILLRVDERRHRRILTAIGAGFLTIALSAVWLYTTVINPPGQLSEDNIVVSIETPYVGEGVDTGTAVILHGLKVGEVKRISKLAGTRVRLDVELQKSPTKGLTDAVRIDFRPANYFGVTGINLIPTDHGQVLRNGASISVTPGGNFTLQALLYRTGELSDQVTTPKLVSVINRATRYTDALNPLFETLIQVSTTITDVQQVSTEQLLRNATATAVGIPPLMDAVLSAGDHYLNTSIGDGFDPEATRAHNPYYQYYSDTQKKYFDDATEVLATDPEKFVWGRVQEYFVGAQYDLFSKIGEIEMTHMYELFPLLEHVRIMADVVPRLVNPVELGDKLRELRSRLERMYIGSGDQHALQVRILLDQLPGIAAPLGVVLEGER